MMRQTCLKKPQESVVIGAEYKLASQFAELCPFFNNNFSFLSLNVCFMSAV